MKTTQFTPMNHKSKKDNHFQYNWGTERETCNWSSSPSLKRIAILKEDSGEETFFEWDRNDTFCISSWKMFTHMGKGQEVAYLFSFSETPLLKNLNIHRIIKSYEAMNVTPIKQNICNLYTNEYVYL